MDRTVPTRGNDEISLYIRTYYSLLRSTREVQLKTLTEGHTHINSALHIDAAGELPDMAAFIYVILRLPTCVADARLVVLGQSAQVFAENGYPDVETWEPVGSPGRRRYSFYDGATTIAVYIASRSDIDDIIPTLAAYQIERRKLHKFLGEPEIKLMLRPQVGKRFSDNSLRLLASKLPISEGDLERLRQIWKQDMASELLTISDQRQSLSVRLLAGSLSDYRRATRKWWVNVAKSLPTISFEDRPIYFVSSNTHSLSNLISGFALRREKELVEFIQSNGTEDLRAEYEDIVESNVPSSRENYLYYALKKFEQVNEKVISERIVWELDKGIYRVPSQHVFDVEVQVIELSRLHSSHLDPRLNLEGAEKLGRSSALIINIDFPLGYAAYLVLSEVARNIANIRGIHIMGKAATLNGRIGDVLLPNVVHDEQSLNTFLFNNCYSADDVAPFLAYGTVLDNQKAVTVLGTFLQNETYMDVFYREGYTIVEMEAGPYLSSIYEMVRPKRYPHNELIDLHNVPFPIGILHYASDTPRSKGKNLGAQNLSYFGMDPTYATMTAILRKILADEIGRL